MSSVAIVHCCGDVESHVDVPTVSLILALIQSKKGHFFQIKFKNSQNVIGSLIFTGFRQQDFSYFSSLLFCAITPFYTIVLMLNSNINFMSYANLITILTPLTISCPHT